MANSNSLCQGNLKITFKESKKIVLLRPQKFCGCGVMVAAPDLGSGGVSRGGSSPPIRTIIQNYEL